MWWGLGILYVALMVTLGLWTWKNGHRAMFFIGFVFPVLWLVGALMRPRPL